jgi:small subunit ribosomal protein S1
MKTPNPEVQAAADTGVEQESGSFAEMLSDFEQHHSRESGVESFAGTIVAVTPEHILVDIGRKIEGALTEAAWREARQDAPVAGTAVQVSVGPRNEEGYYQLSLNKVVHPKDWSGLQAAFGEKKIISGTVVEQVKGGFRVEIGVRAFMPASRSGVREAEDLPNLVGQTIECRITKLDVEKEDVVVDRRVVLEEEQSRKKEEAVAGLREGAVMRGRVRSVMDFGAFIDLGGVDGLLHVMEMSWSRVPKPSDVVKVGDQIEVKILKIDPAAKKISLGLKQLQEDPWTVAARTFAPGQRVAGTVSRLVDFGAFVELIPGVDGLIHLSEMSWDKRTRKPSDVVKTGDRVEVMVLQVNPAERRISLGLKQALGDPWETVHSRFPIGSTIEAPVSSIAAFGAFLDLGEGVEGMIHISDITGEKRLEHPKEVLTKGKVVKAMVIEVDRDKRRIRLGLKQLEPTNIDHYIAEHKAGDTVSGRLVDVHGDSAKVELGEGVLARCRIKEEIKKVAAKAAAAPDVTALSQMLSARWKSGAQQSGNGGDGPRAGQIRSFRIAGLDAAKKLIDLELVG